MNKKVWLLTLITALCMSDAQAITVSYPTKRALKKADRYLSLASTALLFGAALTMMSGKNVKGAESDKILFVYEMTLGLNSISNIMALKHERSIATYAQILLPAITAGAWHTISSADDDSIEYDVAVPTAVCGAVIGLIKNVWDVYALVRGDQSEGIQHD